MCVCVRARVYVCLSVCLFVCLSVCRGGDGCSWGRNGKRRDEVGWEVGAEVEVVGCGVCVCVCDGRMWRSLEVEVGVGADWSG